MNNISGSQNNNISFGQVSKEVKNLLMMSEVQRSLKKYNFTSDDMQTLCSSQLKISLISSNDIGNDLTEFSGLVLTPTKSLKLPSMYITASDKDLLNATPDTFVFCVKKALNMVEAYNKFRKKITSHADSKKQSFNVRLVEKNADAELKRHQKGSRIISGDEDSFELSSTMSHYDAKAKAERKKLNNRKSGVQQDFCKEVKKAWERINGLMIDKTA